MGVGVALTQGQQLLHGLLAAFNGISFGHHHLGCGQPMVVQGLHKAHTPRHAGRQAFRPGQMRDMAMTQSH